MITVVGMWEPGFDDAQNFIEWRIWKQVTQAYAVDRWIMVGSENVGSSLFERFDSVDEALKTCTGTKFFMHKSGKYDIRDMEWPENIVLVFGNATDDLSAHIGPRSRTVKIVTPEPIAAFGATCANVVLHEVHR